MSKVYISPNTRDAAMRALEDLPTDVLLDAMKQAPISSFRRKELAALYQTDLAEHAKTFQLTQKRLSGNEETRSPGVLLGAMSYAKAPKGPSAGATRTLRVRPDKSASMQEGDSLGPMKVKTPDLPDSQAPIYNGMKISGGGGDQATMEGGAE